MHGKVHLTHKGLVFLLLSNLVGRVTEALHWAAVISGRHLASRIAYKAPYPVRSHNICSLQQPTAVLHIALRSVCSLQQPTAASHIALRSFYSLRQVTQGSQVLI